MKNKSGKLNFPDLVNRTTTELTRGLTPRAGAQRGQVGATGPPAVRRMRREAPLATGPAATPAEPRGATKVETKDLPVDTILPHKHNLKGENYFIAYLTVT